MVHRFMVHRFCSGCGVLRAGFLVQGRFAGSLEPGTRNGTMNHEPMNHEPLGRGVGIDIHDRAPAQLRPLRERVLDGIAHGTAMDAFEEKLRAVLILDF